ncbi:MAG: hypothetical protein BWK79_18180 [Beggiatoa sp. IS2]|nr:MAG: hypothetical protein BWK79_18180 [Beggiatoa sp. IS2]
MRPLLFLCLCYTTNGFAIDDLSLQFGTIDGEGWQIHGVAVHLQGLTGKKLAFSVHITTFKWTLLKKDLENLNFQCVDGQYTVAKIICPHATLHLDNQLLDEPEIKLSFTYDTMQQRIQLNVESFAFAGGYIAVQSKTVTKGWWIKCHIEQIDFEKISTILDTLIEVPKTFSFAGKVTLTAEMSGATTLERAKITGQLNELNFSNTQGTQAIEGLTGKITLNIQKNTTGLHGQTALTLTQGEIYSEPVYMDITSTQPVTVTIDSTWKTTGLYIHQFTYVHTGILDIKGFCHFTVDKSLTQFSLEQLTVQLAQSSVAEIYTHYIQSWISHKRLKQLNLQGLISARLEWDTDNHYFMVRLYEISLEDQEKSFGIARLSGTLQWHNHLKNLPTHLNWAGAYITSLKLGRSQLAINLNDDTIKLLIPFQQPILDGALCIDQFQLTHLGQDNMQFTFSGELTPISLTQLTTAFELPVLEGQIFGKIPLLRYENANLNMTDTLQFQLFGGNVRVTRLEVKDLFGTITTLLADIEVNKINLQTLTRVTGFGEIQGDLSGYIRDLQLVNGSAVSFDARFGTPPETTLPRKISQKAIDNLSSLNGGGAVNAVSRSFLRLFEHFSYQSLGWGCVLKEGVCEMRGVAPAAKGYYIIKGGGLPRINVIGYNQRVDWHVLVSRLKNIARAKEAVIE